MKNRLGYEVFANFLLPLKNFLVYQVGKKNIAGLENIIARYSLVIATAYADAKLDRVAGVEDALTVIDLPLNSNNPQMAAIPVSNSVMSWPQIIATSADGKRAYIVEVRSQMEYQTLTTTKLFNESSRRSDRN